MELILCCLLLVGRKRNKICFNSQSEIHTKIISHFSLNREEFTIVTYACNKDLEIRLTSVFLHTPPLIMIRGMA